MIFECRTEEKPFGIVLFDGQSIRPVGCMARITEVVKHYDDGRMDILTRGGERFVIREFIQDRAYMEARVFFFDDAEEDTSDDNLKDVPFIPPVVAGQDRQLNPQCVHESE